MINNTTRERLCIFVFWPLNPNLINPNTQQSQACLWEHAVANSAVTVASLPSSSGKNVFPYGRNSPGNTGLGQVVPGHCPCLYPCTAVKTCSGPTSGSIRQPPPPPPPLWRHHKSEVTAAVTESHPPPSCQSQPRCREVKMCVHVAGGCECMQWCSDTVDGDFSQIVNSSKHKSSPVLTEINLSFRMFI